MEEEELNTINEIAGALKNVISLDNNMMSDELQSQNNKNLIDLLNAMDKIEINKNNSPATTNPTTTTNPTNQNEGSLENALGIAPQNEEESNTITIPSLSNDTTTATTKTTNSDHNVSNNNYNSNNKTIKIYNFNTLSEKLTSNSSSSSAALQQTTVPPTTTTNSGIAKMPIINNVQQNISSIAASGSGGSSSNTQILQSLINIPIIPNQTHRVIKVRLYSILDLCKNQDIYNKLIFCHRELHSFVNKKWELYNQNYTYYLQSVQTQQHYNLIFKNVISFCQQKSHPTLYLQIFIIYHIVKYISLENFQTQPEQEMCLLQLRFGFIISNFVDLCYYAYTIKKMYIIQNTNIETLLTIKHLHLDHHVHNFQSLYLTEQKLNSIGISLYTQINSGNYKIIFNLQVYNFISNFLTQYY